MGIVGLVIAFAPAIGPTLGGWIVDQFAWRYLFYLVFPISLLTIIISYFSLKNVTEVTNPHSKLRINDRLLLSFTRFTY